MRNSNFSVLSSAASPWLVELWLRNVACKIINVPVILGHQIRSESEQKGVNLVTLFRFRLYIEGKAS